MNSPTQPAATILADQSARLRNLEILQKHFPSAIEIAPDGRYTVNAAQLQIALDPAGVKVEEDGFELRWVGKREAYNTAFTPAHNILEPLLQDSKNWDTTGNLLIKGDNLAALRLLRHSYFGKVKLIYIDPPYNTQSDAFIYNDHFGVNQTQILEELGYDKDNIEYIKNIYGARTHSGWLSFMYPRLLLAKDLLKEDGVIFISIDDNEQAQLKLLMDEVFGADNFVTSITTQVNKGGRDYLPIAVTHETLFCYVRDVDFDGDAIFELTVQNKKFDFADSRGGFDARELRNRNPKFSKANRPNLAYDIYVDPASADANKFCCVSLFPSDRFTVKVTPLNSKQQSSVWRWGEKKFAENNAPSINEAHVFAKQKGDGGWNIYEKHRKLTYKAKSIWDETGVRTEQGTKDFKVNFDGAYFDHPKSLAFVKKIISLGAGTDDLVLDFFAGSGTTGEAVMRLNAEDGGNRRFILVQIPQAIDAKKQKEAHKFVTEELGKPATIFEITAERLRRAGEKIALGQASTSSARTDASQATPDGASQPGSPAAPVDIGFRVFEVAADLDALIFQKPLSEATQADLAYFEAAALAASPAQQALRQMRVLHNLLLAEGLPLTTRISEVLPSRLYQAADVAIFLGAVNDTLLANTLTALKASATPPVYLTIYAPWITDDNFLQNLKTQAESLGYSGDKLRLRG